MVLRALFQVLVLALRLALCISSTPDFNLVQVLVQDLVLQSLLNVKTPLEVVKRCYVQCISVKTEKIKSIFLAYFLYHIFYDLVLRHFGSVKSLK